MADITTRFGFGGANLNPGGTGKPTLATVLRDIADDVGGSAAASRVVEESVPVVADLGLLMYEPEAIDFADADAGAAPGIKTRRHSGATLAAGQFLQDAANPRQVEFENTDAITNAIVGYRKAIEQPAMLSSAAETFDLDDADDLSISVDGGTPETALFETGDFGNIDLATAAEVAAVLNTDIAGLTAEDIGGVVVVRSDTLGVDSSIQVTGGTAAAKLTMDTDLHSGTGVKTRKV
jgi:hypothetical protein